MFKKLLGKAIKAIRFFLPSDLLIIRRKHLDELENTKAIEAFLICRAKKSLGPNAPSVKDLNLGDLDQLKNELEKWVLEDDPNNELKNYLNEDFYRFCHTVALIPPKEGQLLEFGANPYFTTRMIKWKCNYQMELANFFDISLPDTGKQSAVHQETQEKEEFQFKHFNSEYDTFPYQDDYFDVVLYCEILEHLTFDPVLVISELNRILKIGGHLIITTPNVARFSNIKRIFAGENIYDPYSGYGPYGRHNREYTLGEVQHILATIGFSIEQAYTATITQNGLSEMEQESNKNLAMFTQRENDLGENIFVRAIKTGECPKNRSSIFYRSRQDLTT